MYVDGNNIPWNIFVWDAIIFVTLLKQFPTEFFVFWGKQFNILNKPKM